MEDLTDITEIIDVDDLSTYPSSKKSSFTLTSPTEEGPTDEDSSGGEEYEFPEDVFTILFLAVPFSKPAIYGYGVFVIQILILVLISLDLLEDNDEENVFKVPPSVSNTVRVAQVIAILIAICSQDDIFDTLALLSVSYETGESLEKFPAATNFSFYWANGLRCFEGLSVVFVSMLFIIQADSVLKIFTNFAAIEFVGRLDDLGYKLAKQGWIGHEVGGFVSSIQEEELPIKKGKNPFMRKFARPLSVLVLCGLLLFMWGVLAVHYQNNGEYLKAATCGRLEYV